jgi:DNA polymerase-3 subunit epsilon
MRLLRLEGQETERPGYVLTLRDVTQDMATHLERTHLLEALLNGVKEALAALPPGSAAEALAHLAEETERGKRRTDTGWWPMENLAAVDLGAAWRLG